MTSKVVSLFTSEQVTIGSSIIYSVPSGTTTILKNISFFNRSTDNTTVYLYIVPKGQERQDYHLAFEKVVASKDTVNATQLYNDALSDGTRLEAIASADNSIVANGSGTEVT